MTIAIGVLLAVILVALTFFHWPYGRDVQKIRMKSTCCNDSWINVAIAIPTADNLMIKWESNIPASLG